MTFAAIVAPAACTDKAASPPKPAPATDTWTDPSPHQSRFARVNGVSLNVLDWGGTGDGLVLIHGMGDSPHSFDDLAPALAGGHHVIAYARRGHGQSDHPAAGPYDNETLVEDRYPERAAGLIYFEAGYDWSDRAMVRLFGTLPIPLSPAPADLVSFPAYRSWWGRWYWPNGTLTASAEAEIRDIGRADRAGTISQPTDAVMDPIFKSLLGYHRDYPRAKALVLALYAERFVSNQLPVPDSVRGKVNAWNGEVQAFQKASIERLRRELRAPLDVHVLPGTEHPNFPMASRDTMVALIKALLAHSSPP